MFVISLPKVSYFDDDAKQRRILCLDPIGKSENFSASKEPLVNLQKCLKAALPFCTEQVETYGEFRPHLTLKMYSRNDVVVQNTLTSLQKSSTCLSFPVSDISLITTARSGKTTIDALSTDTAREQRKLITSQSEVGKDRPLFDKLY